MTDNSINPITIEVIRHGLQAITDEIELDLTRTAFSPLIYEYKDYAVGLVDPAGRLIAQCRGGIPIFLANVLGEAVKDGIAIYGIEDIVPGDVLLTNFPGTTGQHTNHFIVYTPVFGAEGSLAAFSAVLVHSMDLGGKYIGSSGSDTVDVFQEGLQLRTVKLESAGSRVQEIYRIIRHNTRFPQQVLGDLEAQVSASKKGASLFRQLLDRYSDAGVDAAIAIIWSQSEARVRQAVRGIANGTYRASAFLDNDGVDLDKPVGITVQVTVEDDRMTVDFSEMSDQVRGPINSGRNGGGITAARIAFRYLTTPDDMTNEGSFRPLDVVLPDGKLLSARDGAPMGSYSMPLPTVIDTIIAALAGAVPDRVAAGHHGNFGIHKFQGCDPETGRLFSHFDTAMGGWGAHWRGDGAGPFKTLVHADTREVPIEVVEALYPLRVDYFRLRPDSGGAGAHRGGLGIEKRYTALAPCRFTIRVERTQCLPWGLEGGKPGAAAFSTVRVAGYDPEKPVLKVPDDQMQAGDTITISTGGGGGFGRPADRPLESLRADVLGGYVTAAAAKQHYGWNFDVGGDLA